MTISTIIYFIITLGILVTIHEYGHYWVARRCGVKVLRFSVGFGSPLWRRVNKEGVEFVVAAIPLGGYVKMLDEREAAVKPEERHLAFNRQSKLARAAIVAAGPIANFLLAILASWAVFTLGEEGYAPVIGKVEPGSAFALAGLKTGDELIAIDGVDVLTRTDAHTQLFKRIGETGSIRLAYIEAVEGDRNGLPVYTVEIPIQRWLAGVDKPNPYQALGYQYFRPPYPAILGEVPAGGPAAKAGLQTGDKIIRIDGHEVTNWLDDASLIQQKPGQLVNIEYIRAGEVFSVSLRTATAKDEKGNTVGRIKAFIQPPVYPESMRRFQSYGVVDAFYKGINKTAEMIVFTYESIAKLLTGLISTSNLSGPITIAKVAADSAEHGLGPYLHFLALISISLGVLNLLPIPVLDGGHLLFIAIETLIRRPVPEKLQILGQQLGLFFILGIMLLAIFNDISQL